MAAWAELEAVAVGAVALARRVQQALLAAVALAGLELLFQLLALLFTTAAVAVALLLQVLKALVDLPAAAVQQEHLPEMVLPILAAVAAVLLVEQAQAAMAVLAM
jgi:hypothetical protein